MRVRRRSKRIWLVILGVFVGVFLFSFLAQRFKGDGGVDAASLAGFDPGYIISDYQMSNYNSMSEADIQAFLTSKNPCNNRNYSLYQSMVSSYPSIRWHWDNGHFVCISEERFGDGEVIGSGDTAAHIIWQAAQDYRINPQVLIVLLQKEQGLITDDFPNSRQYRSATGYGCPDTAPCSSQYYGFKNQVRKAAAMFRTVLDGGWTNYLLGDNYIQYNPNSGCGGSVVNIRSLATSALYRYTPYQPNVGALAAGYGTAYCGAYGNRNFYLYFEDWFGGITDEVSRYIPLEKPRYMEVKEEVTRVTSKGEAVDIIEKGRILKYTTKTTIEDEMLCLRTEYASNNDIDACVPMAALEEVALKVEKIEADNNKKIIRPGAKKYYIRGDEMFSLFTEPLVRNIVAIVTFNEKKYYVTEFDFKYSKAEYGFLEEDIEDYQSYEKLDSIRTVRLNSDIDRINPITGGFFDLLHRDKVYEFASKIEINDERYYRTKHNTENEINLGVAERDLEKSIFVDFEVPRFFIIGDNAERINPMTGEVFDVLRQGSMVKFVTKTLINDVWYYRTEHNTASNIFLVVAADRLQDI